MTIERRTPPRPAPGAAPSIPFRDRARYGFDEYMSRGTVALVFALAVATVLVVIVATIIIWFAGWVEPEVGPIGVLWRALLATFDPALVGGEAGKPEFLVTLLAVTFAGIFVTSILIGILTTGLEGRLAELRKGRSRVISSGHTVILGWSQQIFTVIEQLLVSSSTIHRHEIVVLAERDKIEMQDEIRARVPAASARGARVVCRTGSPLEAADLRIAAIDRAQSIVVLSSLSPYADAAAIKAILAITNNPERQTDAYHIVAELRRTSNLPAAQIAGGSQALVVVVDDLVARIIAQTCRQAGLSAVYEKLLTFEGDEINFEPVTAELVGTSYGDALLRFDTSTLIGMEADGIPELNPGMDHLIAKGDRLIVISADETSARLLAEPVGGLVEEAIVAPAPHVHGPERTLILDWNRRAPTIVAELDRYVAPGSEVVVVSEIPRAEAWVAEIRATLSATSLAFRAADPTDRMHLEEILADGYDHVIVLSQDDMDPQVADSRTLVTLLHLREIEVKNGYDFSLTTEMVDLRNRALAQVTRADDFIVSDRIASLILSQLSENPLRKPVFDNLFDPSGSEIYLNPAAEYVTLGTPVTFATVVESARRRGETAIGYRDAKMAEDARHSYGVVINPAKTAPVALGTDDRVIVLAAEG